MPITAASLIGGAASIYGASKAASASKKAADQALALQQQQYQQARGDMQPYMQAGQAGLNALQQRLLGGGDPTYGQTAYSTPDAFQYGPNDYTASPGLQWQMQRGMNAINSSQAARGALNSGATLKSLAGYIQGLTMQDFNAQRQFAADQYNKDRDFGRGVYENDRGYLANRYDSQTNNLSNLAGTGLNAANGLAGFGSASANNAGGTLMNNAANVGNAWMAGANAVGAVAKGLVSPEKPKTSMSVPDYAAGIQTPTLNGLDYYRLGYGRFG